MQFVVKKATDNSFIPMKILALMARAEAQMSRLESLALLLLRGILAYGFYVPAKNKWADINAIGEWFASLGYPAPLLNAYAAATIEMLGVGLLVLGLFTRWISLPLMVVMGVAIATVHSANGFEASANGYEIPLYYLLMLFLLVAKGGGAWSIDALLARKK
jgi:putative oxidoreductase